MKGGRALSSFLAAAAVMVFLSQGCATIMTGASQKIPVTSNPPGATVWVDGAAAGESPVLLRLRRNRDHEMRIQKPGYNPAVISITRTSSQNMPLVVLGDAVLGILGGGTAGLFIGAALYPHHEWPPPSSVFIGAAAGVGLIFLFDSRGGRFHDLAPAWIRVTLTKVEGEPRPTIIHLDVDQLVNLRWIAIDCADGPGIKTGQ